MLLEKKKEQKKKKVSFAFLGPYLIVLHKKKKVSLAFLGPYLIVLHRPMGPMLSDSNMIPTCIQVAELTSGGYF